MKRAPAPWPVNGVGTWQEGRTLMVSIAFTWALSEVYERLATRSYLYDEVVVGGPAVILMPGRFDDLPHVTEGQESLCALHHLNPDATFTTRGCVRRCQFCAVPEIEGAFRELDDWPDRPVVCDNNLLAASEGHLSRVFDRLEGHDWCDFNQGLDTRLLTDAHVERIARLKAPVVRLALDHPSGCGAWETAFDRLRSGGIPKSAIRSYVLVAFLTDPGDAWERCEFVESHGALVLPQWYHALDALHHNVVTAEQREWGWTEGDRSRIMGYYYRRRGTKPDGIGAARA